jgi:hypothetical protein
VTNCVTIAPADERQRRTLTDDGTAADLVEHDVKALREWLRDEEVVGFKSRHPDAGQRPFPDQGPVLRACLPVFTGCSAPEVRARAAWRTS